MTPTTSTMTTNAPAQPSTIATNISSLPPPPPPPLTATTGADDSRDVGLIDVHHTLPLASRGLPVSPAKRHVDE